MDLDLSKYEISSGEEEGHPLVDIEGLAGCFQNLDLDADQHSGSEAIGDSSSIQGVWGFFFRSDAWTLLHGKIDSLQPYRFLQILIQPTISTSRQVHSVKF